MCPQCLKSNHVRRSEDSETITRSLVHQMHTVFYARVEHVTIFIVFCRFKTPCHLLTFTWLALTTPPTMMITFHTVFFSIKSTHSDPSNKLYVHVDMYVRIGFRNLMRIKLKRPKNKRTLDTYNQKHSTEKCRFDLRIHSYWD